MIRVTFCKYKSQPCGCHFLLPLTINPPPFSLHCTPQACQSSPHLLISALKAHHLQSAERQHALHSVLPPPGNHCCRAGRWRARDRECSSQPVALEHPSDLLRLHAQDALLKESGFTGSCLDYTPCNVTSTCADPTQKCIVKNTCADPARKCYTVGKLPSGYCICDTCPEKLTVSCGFPSQVNT